MLHNAHIRLLRTAACLVMAAGAVSCASDWRNGIDTQPDTPTPATTPFTFSGTVVSSATATRADGSVVNKNEQLLPTKSREIYRSGNSTPERVEYYVGVFGAYTGSHTWGELEKLAANKTPSNDDGPLLSEYYTARLLFNQQMKIEKATTGTTNALTYDPLRFWPNNTYSSGSTTPHEMATFWAYYPWNATAQQGDYGISINESAMGTAMGMGSVTFKMNTDAALQSDFMMSYPVVDCNRDTYPLVQTAPGVYAPHPVRFQFHHMLAQVRLYAFCRGTDKLVRSETEKYVGGEKYYNDYGIEVEAVAGEYKVIEEECERWDRTGGVMDVTNTRQRANLTYSLSFNNVHTECTFSPEYDDDGNFTGFTYNDATSLDNVTVSHYIMNPYWFRFDTKTGERYQLNDTYMYGNFEETPAYLGGDATATDGRNWGNYTAKPGGFYDPLNYITDNSGDQLEMRQRELAHIDGSANHYNYAPGNILLMVPQVLLDDDVPSVTIEATGTTFHYKVNTDGTVDATDRVILNTAATGRVTVNMLNMNLKWESGFIYNYAFIDDDLHPGDDKVKGPENILVVFDPTQQTDQW